MSLLDQFDRIEKIKENLNTGKPIQLNHKPFDP